MSKVDSGKFPCPCCGYLTLAEKARGSFEICPVCYWEDDRSQFEDPTSVVGANSVSLEQARRNFAEYGASRPELRAHVGPPREDEIPKP